MSVFSGLGAGTSVDPYQITTVAQLKEMRDFYTGVIEFFGLVSAPMTISTQAYYGTGIGNFKYVSKGNYGLSSVTIVNGGTGYKVNDVVLITGGNNQAQFRVSSVATNGVVTGLVTNNVNYGLGYPISTICDTTNYTVGAVGTGLQVSTKILTTGVEATIIDIYFNDIFVKTSLKGNISYLGLITRVVSNEPVPAGEY